MHPTALAQIRKFERADLEVLLGVLHGAKTGLRRDESGDWIILGSRGSIRTCAGSFTITIDPRSSRRWSSVKKALANFATCVQDYDGEGTLRITRLPHGQEITRLRDVIGLRQARPSAADHLAPFRFSPPSKGGFSANHAPKPVGGCRTPGKVKGASAVSARPLEGMTPSGDQEAAR